MHEEPALPVQGVELVGIKLSIRSADHLLQTEPMVIEQAARTVFGVQANEDAAVFLDTRCCEELGKALDQPGGQWNGRVLELQVMRVFVKEDLFGIEVPLDIPATCNSRDESNSS